MSFMGSKDDINPLMLVNDCLLLKVLGRNFIATWCINSEKIIGKNDFPYHFKKIIVRYKQISYNIDVLRQTACLVVSQVKVNRFAYLFNCTKVGRTSD